MSRMARRVTSDRPEGWSVGTLGRNLLRAGARRHVGGGSASWLGWPEAACYYTVPVGPDGLLPIPLFLRTRWLVPVRSAARFPWAASTRSRLFFTASATT